jgi:hypothetical protein
MPRSAAIAGPEIEAKTVNTKTDNANNFFMGVVLLNSYLAHRHAARFRRRQMCWGSQSLDLFDISGRERRASNAAVTSGAGGGRTANRFGRHRPRLA